MGKSVKGSQEYFPILFLWSFHDEVLSELKTEKRLSKYSGFREKMCITALGVIGQRVEVRLHAVMQGSRFFPVWLGGGASATKTGMRREVICQLLTSVWAGPVEIHIPLAGAEFWDCPYPQRRLGTPSPTGESVQCPNALMGLGGRLRVEHMCSMRKALSLTPELNTHTQNPKANQSKAKQTPNLPPSLWPRGRVSQKPASSLPPHLLLNSEMTWQMVLASKGFKVTRPVMIFHTCHSRHPKPVKFQNSSSPRCCQARSLSFLSSAASPARRVGTPSPHSPFLSLSTSPLMVVLSGEGAR